MIRKVQERKEGEGFAANVSDVRDYDYGVQESGTVEKEIVEREVKEEAKENEDVKVLTESVRSMSL